MHRRQCTSRPESWHDDRPEPLNEYAETLLTATLAAIPGWVGRSVESVARQAGIEIDVDGALAIDEAAAEALAVIGARLRQLLDTDVDEQRSNPLAILRGAIVYPTSVLRSLGVVAVARHQFEAERFPDDIYGLTPATWADIDESLYEPGIVWGAWKAKTVLDRRRGEGRR
jgi:hypothetical protein